MRKNTFQEKLLKNAVNRINTYFISPMAMSGTNFRWSKPVDCVWYDRDEIIKNNKLSITSKSPRNMYIKFQNM